MGLSIQDYAKKINSWISLVDCISLLVTMLFLVGFVAFLHGRHTVASLPVTYYVATSSPAASELGDTSRPFGSTKGKTYTFSWCRNSGAISAKNKIYFDTEDLAKQSGRVLSKFCQK
jgi:hypothetical protein